jgi:non-heme chloroperoxidase
MAKTAANPNGTPLSAFDAIRNGLAENRPEFFKDVTLPFFGYDRQGTKVSEGIRESLWLQGNLAAIMAVYNCVEQFSEIDWTEDLKKFDAPTRVVHGDDDQGSRHGIPAWSR